MKNFVRFLAIGLLVFSVAIIVGVAQASRLTSISGLNSNQNSAAATPAPTATPQVIDVIEASVAGENAVKAAGFNETFASTPTLVDFQGKVAYEVPMQGGYIAYVDAVSGDLLYNPFTGDATATIASDQALQIASQYLNNSSIYGWGAVLYQQLPVYEVGFQNGDIVLVNPHGQVVYVQQANSGSHREFASGSDH
jgi:hypothetical protein